MHIFCTGSIRLTHALIWASLVDEYRLVVYPTVQGGGRRLFAAGYEISGLGLLESRAFRNGVTLQQYAASDTVKAGAAMRRKDGSPDASVGG